MPKKVQKTLQDYLAKVKSPRHSSQNHQSQKPFNSFSFSSSKNWIIKACKHPRTPSITFDDSHGGRRSGDNHKDDAATLADVDRFLYENFKSLYFREGEETEGYYNNNKGGASSGEIQHDQGSKLIPMFDSLRLAETPRDLGGSKRFFVKTALSGSLFLDDGLTTRSSGDDHHYGGSSSNSTVTNTDSSSNDENHHENDEKLPENCIALLRSSSSPYEDFRRSMQDVVEARFKSHGKVIDWEFMEELLLSYLNLNEKKSHKFILSAFVDVTAAMRPNSEMTDPHPRSVRTVRFGREGAKKTKEFTLEFGSSN
ncbi:hypothetical protein PIB30_032723 [Stylosanthes scabra]|uniref:Transcription repressor n=1 Tax=Stylosanthes scabra TaxID=79078 RepID=A0ABU6SC40_9FABA|nr:hypothetical protein [Stylosanthes scabra]